MLCLGIVDADALVKGNASGAGNPVYYVGAKTGRDGIHGATMASAEFDEKALEKRPAVQVGDPFMEKLLLEACLELMATDALIGVQDMGAAGLTCSTCEMGSRGGAGVEIDVMHVPQRETGMTPYEIMLSESQERMLLVVKKGREAEVEAIFDKWDLHAAHIGEVTTDGLMRVKDHGKVVAEIAEHRPGRRGAGLRPPDDAARLHRRGPRARPGVAARRSRRRTRCCALLASPTDREQALGLPAVRHDGADQHHRRRRPQRRRRPREGDRPRAGDRHRRQRPLLLPESAPRRDAGGRRGGAQRRLRRRACRSARPTASTSATRSGPRSCGSSSRRSKGIAEACRALDIPITGGNVSLYNETDGQAIYPTPVIGVVGLIEDASRVLTRAFQGSGDAVILLGEDRGELGGSEYLKVVHGLVRGDAPALDLAREAALIEAGDRAPRPPECYARRTTAPTAASP